MHAAVLGALRPLAVGRRHHVFRGELAGLLTYLHRQVVLVGAGVQAVPDLAGPCCHVVTCGGESRLVLVSDQLAGRVVLPSDRRRDMALRVHRLDADRAATRIHACVFRLLGRYRRCSSLLPARRYWFWSPATRGCAGSNTAVPVDGTTS